MGSARAEDKGRSMSETLDFDPDALREKYREERDKRLRADGNDQYVEVKGDFSHYVDDPYVEPGFTREPLTDDGRRADHRRRLRRPAGRRRGCARPGVEDIRIIEKGGDFGGTWYWNRYPGAQCDIESVHLSAAARRDRLHPEGEVLLRAGDPASTARRIGEHFDLYRDACFQTEISEITLERGREPLDRSPPIATTRMRARFVVMSNGPLNRPKLPGIPGIDTFKGHTFHTSRWDYAYTGGDYRRAI